MYIFRIISRYFYFLFLESPLCGKIFLTSLWKIFSVIYFKTQGLCFIFRILIKFNFKPAINASLFMINQWFVFQSTYQPGFELQKDSAIIWSFSY